MADLFVLCFEQVENLNLQMLEQKKNIDQQKGELNNKGKELDSLKTEEAELEHKIIESKSEADQVFKNAADTQLEISSLRTNLLELEEYKRRVDTLMQDYDAAITHLDYVKIAALLPRNITPPPFLSEADQSLHDLNSSKPEFSSDPFAGEDPFKSKHGQVSRFLVVMFFSISCR